MEWDHDDEARAWLEYAYIVRLQRRSVTAGDGECLDDRRPRLGNGVNEVSFEGGVCFRRTMNAQCETTTAALFFTTTGDSVSIKGNQSLYGSIVFLKDKERACSSFWRSEGMGRPTRHGQAGVCPNVRTS